MSLMDWWHRRTAPGQRPDSPPPNLHLGGTENWGLDRAVLDFLPEIVTPESVSIETGAGLSTITLARVGCHHTVLTPSADEIIRVKAECDRLDIATTNLRFIEGRSENVLPTLQIAPLDLAILDGSHAMPVPFVDWCYLAPRLKPGGILIIDDTQIWTGATLRDFLTAEWQWEVVRTFSRTVAFRKKSDPVLEDWASQPYVMARSTMPSGWAWWNNALHGHVTALDSALKEIERQGSANKDAIKSLLWVERELLDCVRRIEGICAAKEP